MTKADDGSAVTDGIFMALAAEYAWPDYGQRERATVTLDPKALDALGGEYQVLNPNVRGAAPIPVLVSSDGGRLFLEVKPYIPKLEIFAASADSFFTSSGDDVIFTRDRSGRGATINLEGQIARE